MVNSFMTYEWYVGVLSMLGTVHQFNDQLSPWYVDGQE